MKPVTTKLTAIDDAIVLRRSKRIGSGVRSELSSRSSRLARRDWFERCLDDHPLHIDGFRRFVFHLNETLPDPADDAEEAVVERECF